MGASAALFALAASGHRLTPEELFVGFFQLCFILCLLGALKYSLDFVLWALDKLFSWLWRSLKTHFQDRKKKDRI
ncbi:hypothetical protein [uncultured Oscillibacter sp.]|uniref:hypothetical protein n=1 Tax=uncultured Oscillibacter sp. TaxID=876091 RepID=UPI0025EA2601|nr:hypothetical protein [uncultured Oscillibacter sp.]